MELDALCESRPLEPGRLPRLSQVKPMNLSTFLSSIVYAVTGIVVFCLGFIIVDKLTPYNLWQELVEKKNTALALVVGLAALGVCIIIAAAIH
jgi:putative membrane protein